MTEKNTENSADAIRETLSAMLDNEASELEIRRVLREVEQETDLGNSVLADQWRRFALVQESLKHDVSLLSENFASRVASAIDAEPVPNPADSSPFSGWRENLTKFAVAASVAAVAFVALQPGAGEPGQPLAGQPASPESVASAPVMLATENTDAEPGAVNTEYLRQYIEQMTLDFANEPPRTEHIQDSPLYRLVNEYQPVSD